MVSEKTEGLWVKRPNRILTLLLTRMKDLTDEGRELPIRWNIMHMYTSSQLAKMLALRRGIDPELAAITAALHDVGLLVTRAREGHAEAAKGCVRGLLDKHNREMRQGRRPITPEEIDKIVDAVARHREKDIVSDDPFVELLKDVDSLDRYLHGIRTEGAH